MKYLPYILLACALAAGPAFALPVISSVTVTKLGTGSGTVYSSRPSQSCPPAQGQCTFAYVGLFMEQLTATPSAGSVFVDWTGCYSTAGNVCYVSIGDSQSANKQVTASFMLGPAFPDFSADGKPDLVWRHGPSGATSLWRMNGPALLSDAFIATVDPAWKMAGVGDFDSDGYSDLVWRHAAGGDTYVWYMDGASYVSSAFLFTLPPEWVIEAIADFNQDGKPDFLMRNSTTGLAFVWFFDGNVPLGNQFLFSFDPSWRVVGVGDFDGNGQPDFLFRNTASGVAFVGFTEYSGGTLSFGASGAPLFAIDPAWEVAQVADWNGDGWPDLLFRNRDTGVVIVWYLTGTTLGASDYVIQVDPAWEIVPRP